MSSNLDYDLNNPKWRDRFLAFAGKAGLLNTEVRPQLRHCPNGHELHDEVRERFGRPMWVQIQDCPKCQQQEGRAQMMDRIIDRLTKAGVPEMFQCWTSGTTPDNRSEREPLLVDDHNYAARLACARYPSSRWVMFAGDVGVGKTSWSSALFCDVVDSHELPYGASKAGLRQVGIKGLWMSEADLFMRCDEAHHKDGYNARTSYLRTVCRAPLLLLDDLGGSRRALTEWQGGAIRHLFDHRHKHNLPTFLTTNLTHWAPLAERYGDHVVSRMIDRCGNMTILTGTDRRL